MKKTLFAFTCLFAGLDAYAADIVIKPGVDGLAVETLEETTPKSGNLLSCEVTLPPFTKGNYYRPYSGGTARGNRVESVAFSSLADLKAYEPSKTRKGHASVSQGQFMLLQISANDYLAILPLVSPEAYCQLQLKGNKLTVNAGNFGTDLFEGELPLLAWSYGKTPYAATQAVWKQVMDSGDVLADWRSNKSYPETYGYLGWCSWEHYKSKINEKIISNAVLTLEECGAPVRWVMVDDGYLDEESRKLVNFPPNKEKFPNGWKPIMDLRKEDKIKWFGIWRNTAGFMGGISNNHTMSDIAQHLVKVKSGGAMLPNGTAEGAKSFYDKMAKDSKDSGFNFTKVDFQTKAFDLYKGLANPVSATRVNHEALENACKQYGLPLLNCIGQPNVNSMNSKYSALTRSSPDYNKSDKDKNKCNTYQSFSNHLWMSQTVWGDLDMFHTHDERDVVPMALARAISGGPVYISDEPSKINPEILLPFAYADGKLLRTAAPATLLPESFFIHPFRDENVFRVVAPLEDNVAAIGLFNFSESGKTLPSSLNKTDYSLAGELLQPSTGPWSQPAKGLLVYDRENKTVTVLDETFETEVGDFGAKLFFVYPNTEGWAVIGRGDKYLPSAAVKVNEVAADKVSFTLKESGPLTVWSEKGEPKMDGATFTSLGGSLYLADLPVKSGAVEITLTR